MRFLFLGKMAEIRVKYKYLQKKHKYFRAKKSSVKRDFYPS